MSTHTPQKHYAKAAAQVVQNYVKAQEETTPPDQVILLLLDGVLRFIEEAKSHIDKEEFKEKNLVLVKAQTIVKELMDALDPSIGEMAFRNLRGLYFFAYRKLVEANVHNDVKILDEAAEVSSDLREMWGATVDEYHKQLKDAAESAKAPSRESDEQQVPIASLSVEC